MRCVHDDHDRSFWVWYEGPHLWLRVFAAVSMEAGTPSIFVGVNVLESTCWSLCLLDRCGDAATAKFLAGVFWDQCGDAAARARLPFIFWQVFSGTGVGVQLLPTFWQVFSRTGAGAQLPLIF